MATILIVDPDPATRSLLELLILRLGHRPIGQRELSEGEEPDLVLLEPVSQPAGETHTRARDRLPQLPVLCVSIDAPSLETRELGVVGYVMKPFRRSQLERALELALVPASEAFEARHTA